MKVFGEERINTYFSNSQTAPAVAALSGGGYVVTWASTGQDGSGDGIYSQRLDANGVGIGLEFQVNTTSDNTQTDPAIAGLSDGGFLIVWTDYRRDESSYGVFAQRYDAGAVPQGVEFQINTYTAYDQGPASIDSYNGGFVVTWYSHFQDGSGYGVYNQRYDNLGNKVGVET
ncbi:MAG: flagellar hook associated protein, partial [Candidatus Accumulibacter sp.]|nr:flagellar hook associated protein [Accumulibacter sp.]